MRQIFLDTETTGIGSESGHRIIEVAAVEVIDRRPTGKHYHAYVNPERDIDQGAMEVHGITREFLADKPKFTEICDEFLAFVDGAEVVIHNAPFDVGFLNMELGLLGKEKFTEYVSGIVDTLKMAKEMRPGQRNNLDALCKSYKINNSRRVLHGALLDAELLSEVYLVMTRKQNSLFDMEMPAPAKPGKVSYVKPVVDKPAEIIHPSDDSPISIKVMTATDEEMDAHMQYIESLSKSGAMMW